ncbi:MAG: dTDP-4-dehydrorhamnose 3,5-epimerase [Acidimicrobiia bacterium]
MIRVAASHMGEVLELEATTYSDDRGFFVELGRTAEFDRIGLPPLVQTNLSSSHRGVVRGIHYQMPPNVQGKLVSVPSGEIWDVAVDLRKSSRTFGKWVGVSLSSERMNMLYVPPGFGHGFVARSAPALVMYRTTAEFDPEADRSLAFDDPTIAIDWPRQSEGFSVSEKDRGAPRLADADVFA